MNTHHSQDNEKIPLDIDAYLVIFIGILSIILSILLYLFFSQQANRYKVETIYQYQGIWLSTPKQLLWFDKNQQQLLRLDKTLLGLSNDDQINTMLLLSTPDSTDENTQNLWLRLSSFQVFHCQITLKSHEIQVKKTCELLPETKNLKSYANILTLPKVNQILLIDNTSGLMQTYDATTGNKLLNIDYYKVPKLPTFDELTEQLKYSTSLHELDQDTLDERLDNKLFQANYGKIFNTDISMVASIADINQKSLYIQTDTGNYRLLAWQISPDEMPDFAKPAIVWLKTQSQPFDVIMIPKDDDRNVVNWITLEADENFKNSKVRRYNHLLGREDRGNTLDLPISQPDFFTQIDDTLVLIADKKTAKVIQVDFKNPAEPVITDWQPNIIQADIDHIMQWRQYFVWLSYISLILCLVPVYCLLWLYRMGYDLTGQSVYDDEMADDA